MVAENCSNCGSGIYYAKGRELYGGLCKPCFPTIKFGFPYKWENLTWIGKRDEIRTEQRGFAPYAYLWGGDAFDNVFRVGDIVAYDPDLITFTEKGLEIGRNPLFPKVTEGKVLEIHEYRFDGVEGDDFLTKIYFPGDSRLGIKKATHFLAASRLEALTCENVDFDITKYNWLDNGEILCEEGKIDDDQFQKILDTPIARAIWMSYAGNHVFLSGAESRFNNLTLELSEKIVSRTFEDNRIHLWFKKEMGANGFKMGDNQIASLVPYLLGEEIAHYKIVKKAS